MAKLRKQWKIQLKPLRAEGRKYFFFFQKDISLFLTTLAGKVQIIKTQIMKPASSQNRVYSTGFDNLLDVFLSVVVGADKKERKRNKNVSC